MSAQPELEGRAVACEVRDGELLAEDLERLGADGFRVAPDGANQPVADFGEHFFVARRDLAERRDKPGCRTVQADGERKRCGGEAVAKEPADREGAHMQQIKAAMKLVAADLGAPKLGEVTNEGGKLEVCVGG